MSGQMRSKKKTAGGFLMIYLDYRVKPLEEDENASNMIIFQLGKTVLL